MATIVVFVEQENGAAKRASLESIAAAVGAGGSVIAVVTGPGSDTAAATLGNYGTERVVQITGADAWSPDGTAADVAAVAQDAGATVCLAAATSAGKDVMPRVAALLDSVPLTDCTDFRMDGDKAVVVRPVLAGKVIANVESASPVFCATLRPNSFKVAETGGSAEVSQAAASADRKVTVVEVAAKAGGALDVKEAPVVVSGGRGLKEPEHFKLVEDLAAAFGDAAVGASRAVVDAGWRPHAEQVGQTGKVVSPKLYVAVGISGAIQHLAGMRTAKTIVAINKDAAAPIFKVADYGIVGDAFEVVPALTAAVKAAKAE
jgi:electron transfer flavoprotein alpha subunit